MAIVKTGWDMHLKTSKQEKLELGYGNYSCNWGVHIAALYETEEERDKILRGFLAEGVQNNDLQLYCPTEQTVKEFKDNFKFFYPHISYKLDDPANIIFKSARELYYPNGTFSLSAMDKGITEFYMLSQKNGKRYVRAAVEMIWALGAMPGIEHLMAYEARLNRFVQGKPWVSISMYNTTKFTGQFVINVLNSHPYILNGGVLMQNPYFQDPEKWLEVNAPQFLPA